MPIYLISVNKTPERAALLICSSQWTSEEQDQAVTVAKASLPSVSVITIPPGLDVREGSEGILSFLKGAIQNLLADSKK
ncbi:hypothetical protein V502_05997 [Pseudogymnoascus sp. VKM F-4520 (FW-2644)]|nr:hypothetical protein V502_05997 [Pseudogymnoascus sp. VKM F-4520 (FW-2644)]